MTAVRYVLTDDARKAVIDRETAILSALGIDPPGRGQHILCPYADHPDRKPSWRWDQSHRRAFCSCGNEDILGVVGRVRACDFDEAKLFAVEAVGRAELIKTKANGSAAIANMTARVSGARQGPGGHAARLLARGRPEEHDDELGRAYLAFRLGVEPGDVVMPATKVVGWHRQAYFDPPERNGERPVHVGAFPCVAFETRRVDGVIHAHRIYVAEGGQGKADLGAGPDGPRDPKKTARREDGVNTSGCSVIWGNPETAGLCILTEGIETGAAVALALAAEIAAGDALVAAALTAGGVEAFQPWPATRQVTVAADRDDAKPPGTAGYQRGQRAARAFCGAYHG